jgi:hypothetical protein
MHATRYNTGTVTWKHKEAKEYTCLKQTHRWQQKSMATPHI